MFDNDLINNCVQERCFLGMVLAFQRLGRWLHAKSACQSGFIQVDCPVLTEKGIVQPGSFSKWISDLLVVGARVTKRKPLRFWANFCQQHPGRPGNPVLNRTPRRRKSPTRPPKRSRRRGVSGDWRQGNQQKARFLQESNMRCRIKLAEDRQTRPATCGKGRGYSRRSNSFVSLVWVLLNLTKMARVSFLVHIQEGLSSG